MHPSLAVDKMCEENRAGLGCPQDSRDPRGAPGRKRRRFRGPLRPYNSRGLELQDLVVVERLLEVFAVGEEVEELEGLLTGLLHPIPDRLVEELLTEVVLPGATPLDLDEVRRRENRAEEAKVEDVRAVVAE